MNRGTLERKDGKEHPLVSIALCTYNGERFLREQMDSLIAQDYARLEIIITDDASSDSTVDILQDYERQHRHIHVVQNETTLGLTANFGKALGLCSGEYIALCDQDDIWFPNKISTLVQQIGTTTLIYTPVELIDENRKPLGQGFYARRNIRPVSGKCNKALVFENCILGHTLLFRRELLPCVLPIPDGIPAHDQWISILAASVGTITFHDEVLSCYRLHQSNVSIKNKNQKKPIREGMLRWQQRQQRNRIKFQKQQKLLLALSQSGAVPEADRELFRKMYSAYSAFPRVWKNVKLARLIKKEGDAFLAVSNNKQKALNKICRGGLAGLLRW